MDIHFRQHAVYTLEDTVWCKSPLTLEATTYEVTSDYCV
jgi:hypothetical protein